MRLTIHQPVMIMYLLIDDERNYGADIIARTAKAGKLVLANLSTSIDVLGIDHDLGENVSGYDIVKWAEANGYLPNKVQVISSNPVGRKAIANVLLDAGYRTIDNTNFLKVT